MRNHYLFMFVLASLLIITGKANSGLPTSNDKGVSEIMFFTLYINYDEFHNHLIGRCTSLFPETVRTLKTAIAQWSKKNKPAIDEIRSL